jgi:crotonobetainyl-CoA:carnitine CoA-transferase CaiB-like acyl-CoA transferase
MGNAHPNLVPYQPFPCVDGMVVIAVGNDGQFRTLCAELGAEALAADTRYATNAGRIAHRAELVAAISAMTRSMTMAGLMAILEPAGVPCGPINTLDQVFDEPQAKHRGLEIEQSRADLSALVRTVASPIRMSGTPARYDTAPPALGQDTDAVLSSLT